MSGAAISPNVPECVKTGDRAGLLTFLGIAASGKALCRCDCGEVEEFAVTLIAEPLRKQSRRRLGPRHLLRCTPCRELQRKMKLPWSAQ